MSNSLEPLVVLTFGGRVPALTEVQLEAQLESYRDFLTGRAPNVFVPGARVLHAHTVGEHVSDRTDSLVDMHSMNGGLRMQEVPTGPTSESSQPPPLLNANPQGYTPTEQSDAVADIPPEVMAMQNQLNVKGACESYRPDQVSRCRICEDDFSEDAVSVFLNCGHTFCMDCLNACVRAGLSNKQFFPPRCCTSEGIDIDGVAPFLEEDLLLHYTMVEEEFSIRHPTFCANKNCSRLFSEVRLSKNVGKFIACHGCDTKTCMNCRQARAHHISNHEDIDACPELISKEDKELADGEKWKQCPGCRNLVEKEDRCSHMNCDCGAEFCYECGQEFNEDNSCGYHTEADEDGWHHRRADGEAAADDDIDAQLSRLAGEDEDLSGSDNEDLGQIAEGLIPDPFELAEEDAPSMTMPEA